MYRILATAYLLLTATAMAMAQPFPPAPSSSEGAPLDGFTLLLLASGAAYGVHRVRTKKQDQ